MCQTGGNSTKSSTETVIDIRSDTVSLPTDRMREAMAHADLGDDVYCEDPTVQKLEERCAKLFGKEAALFVTSGTMGNLIAIMIHCSQRSSEVIVGENSHVYLYEQGGAASIASVLISTIPNNADGTFSLNELRSKIRGSDCHEAKTSLVVVENTHNVCGGKVIPLEWLAELNTICKSHKLKMHMDGARIFNAAEYLNVPVSRIVRDFDSLTFCLSKGLCAPIGSVLIGSKEFIEQARYLRKGLGGGMRQVGVLAAAGLVALDDIVPNLGGDHRHAKQIAKAIYDLKSPFVTVEVDTVQTNICMIHLLQPDKYSTTYLLERLERVTEKELSAGITDKHGNGIILKVGIEDKRNCLRYLTYHHINDEITDLAIKKFKFCIEEMK